MTLEADLYTALKDLVANRVYRDVAPPDVADLPRCTFQQVGGSAVNFVDPSVPSKKNARVQVNFWAADRDQAMDLARQGEDALRAYVALQVTVLGAAVAVYEPETLLYGSMQDFSVWS